MPVIDRQRLGEIAPVDPEVTAWALMGIGEIVASVALTVLVVVEVL